MAERRKKLKLQGIKKKDRPLKPKKNNKYPTKLNISLGLLSDFFQANHEIKITCVLADAFYGSANFVNKASKLNGGIQVISQIRSNQLVRNKRGLLVEVRKHFKDLKPVERKVSIRGGATKSIFFCPQKIQVEAHKEKRVVIAIKYAEEKEYRYIIASNMSWQDLDIIRAYTLRWLIEVFFQDWKAFEGWNNLAKQQGDEGSSKCVILSLLLDHSFFFHEFQQPCIENKLPLHTIGSLVEESRLQIIKDKISTILKEDDPQKAWREAQENLEHLIPRRFSEKHMSHRGFKNVFLEAG